MGDTIAYAYQVTNTGNVTLASLAVNDPSRGAVTCPAPASPGLAPGASETCTADETHTVTQADVDAGQVNDTATATGTDTQGDISPPSAPSTFVVSGTPTPAVVIHKTGTVSPVADQNAAKRATPSPTRFLVTNIGNVTLASVAVADPTLGPGHLPDPEPRVWPPATPRPARRRTHTVTQADVDAGSVVDTATATGTDTQGDVSPTSDPSTVAIQTVAPAPKVVINEPPSDPRRRSERRPGRRHHRLHVSGHQHRQRDVAHRRRR